MIELLQKAGPERRFELGIALCDEALDIARQGIARAYPQASEEEQGLLFVEFTYGKEGQEVPRQEENLRPSLLT